MLKENFERKNFDETVKAYVDIMSSYSEIQDDPMIGIFWYDTHNDELFGVNSEYPSDDFRFHNVLKKDVKISKKLHMKVWDKESRRVHKDPRFSGGKDTWKMIPRGRVIQTRDGFEVLVGSWINDYPSAKELIIEEFQLPKDTKFTIEEHWEIGNGFEEVLA